MKAHLPLLNFFLRLRKHSFDLDIESYKTMLNALASGFGLESSESLLSMCKTLWLKSIDKVELFEKLFQESFREEQHIFFSDNEQLPDLNNQPSHITTTSNLDSQISDDGELDNNSGLPMNEHSGQNFSDEPRKDWIKLIIQNLPPIKIPETQKIKCPIRSKNKFQLSGNCFPFSESPFMQQWRLLQKKEIGQQTNRVNIEETISEIIREGGILVNPIFNFSTRNTFMLITLIDHKGSMMAFENLCETLITTARKGAELETQVYYFFNVPQNVLYQNKDHTHSVTIRDLLQEIKQDNCAVLIISDGGASRGTFNPNRIDATKTFILRVLKKTNRIVWMNPFPESRWKETSAESISHIVPMFEINHSGVGQAATVSGIFDRRYLRGEAVNAGKDMGKIIYVPK